MSAPDSVAIVAPSRTISYPSGGGLPGGWDQRSTIELLRYLTTSGPALIQYAKGQPMDADAIAEATRVANSRDFEGTVAALTAASGAVVAVRMYETHHRPVATTPQDEAGDG